MTIQPGERIPEASFKTLGDEGIKEVTSLELFQGRKIVLFGMPGAFTPTCAKDHLPDAINHANDIRKRGVDKIICVSINDPFVMKQWSRISGADGKVMMLADWNGEFIKSMGLETDASKLGLGTCSKRFAMIIDNSVVKTLDIEARLGDMKTTSARALLEKL